MKNKREKYKEQAISVMIFLVENWRQAVNKGGNYEPIMRALQSYLDALKEYKIMSNKEINILYLKAKIKVSQKQIKKYKEELKIIGKKEVKKCIN